MRLPIYKLKLVRSGWISFPPVDVKQPQLAAYFLHKMIGQAVVEHSAAIFLGALNQVVGSTVISVGDLDRVPVLAREVFKSAILANASGVILAHNHPAGLSLPSPADIRVTRRLIRAGEIVGIHVLDHIIVTPSGDFTSLRETGELLLWWPSNTRVPKEPVASARTET
jgi:DNA repair protein RadC